MSEMQVRLLLNVKIIIAQSHCVSEGQRGAPYKPSPGPEGDDRQIRITEGDFSSRSYLFWLLLTLRPYAQKNSQVSTNQAADDTDLVGLNFL